MAAKISALKPKYKLTGVKMFVGLPNGLHKAIITRRVSDLPKLIYFVRDSIAYKLERVEDESSNS